VATVADDAILSEAAALVFGGYHGHYHADPRLDRAACDAAYVSWARRCLNTPDAADNVLMFFQRGVLVSFVTMRLVSADEGEVVLGGVLPSAQGRGLWRPTLGGVLRWSEARGARRVIASTQVTNVASQRIWTRMGFSPVRSEATLHVWFD
jgi:GNAT superfamily N-acetyltransferase